MLHAETSQLLLVDFQQRLMPAIAEGDAVVAVAARLAEAALRLGVPCLATEQYPRGLGSTVPALAAFAAQPLEKIHFDATSAEGFARRLAGGRPQAVVAGCETHVCVLQTCLGLRRKGFDVAVVADATGSRRAADRDAGLARMAAHGCEIVTVEMVLFEWLGHAGNPAFRDILTLIK